MLVPASGGRTYDNVNPATESVIGVTADATADDIGDAIAAARRAFDESTWSTDPAFRGRDWMDTRHRDLLLVREQVWEACLSPTAEFVGLSGEIAEIERFTRRKAPSVIT